MYKQNGRISFDINKTPANPFFDFLTYKYIFVKLNKQIFICPRVLQDQVKTLF